MAKTPPKSAARKSTPKTFHYKQVALAKAAKHVTLQGLLTDVFNVQPKPIGRVQDIVIAPGIAGENDVKEHVVIALRLTHKDMICGLLQRIEPGSSVPASIMSDEADNWQIKSYKPPVSKDGKEKAEFLKNHLYFGVRGNHVILTQENGFGSPQLQNHFQWLFDRFVRGFSEAKALLLLQDHIPAGYERDFSKVRKLKIETQPAMKVAEKKKKSEQPLSWVIEKDPLIDAFFDVMQKSRKNPLGKEPAELDKAYREGSLKATITLHYTGGKESPLSPVATDLLNTTGLKWKMELPKREPLTSEQTNIQRTYPVEIVNGIAVPGSVADRMVLMLDSLVKQREIAPD